MSRVWNCLDDVSAAQTATDRRTIVVQVSNVEDLGSGNGRVTIELLDATRRPYNFNTLDEVVIDFMISDAVLNKPSSKGVTFSGVGGGAIIEHGGGTALMAVIAQDWSFTITMDIGSNPTGTWYLSAGQGHGSTYLVRAAARYWPVAITA